MYSRYYQSELTYLRDMGARFGRVNPAIAGLLAEQGSDPDVERLLEGFAFLAARIRERVDDCVPEVVHALMEIVAPHYLRTVPAASIVEFFPQTSALRGRHTIPRGAKLGATPVRGCSCLFRTTSDVDLLPLSIDGISLDKSSINNSVLRLECSCSEKSLGAVFNPKGIRFFLGSEYATAAMLLLWFLRYCTQIQVRPLGPGLNAPIALPPNLLAPAGFSDDAALVPWPAFSPPSFRILEEYFAQPAKFLFVDLLGLNAALPAAREHFELAFFFERPPELPTQITTSAMRLHCTPVVNLFGATANPVRRSAIEHEHLLQVADIDPEHADIYSVDSVVGARAGMSERVVYERFLSFSHAAGAKGSPFYTLRPSLSALDGALDTYFSIVTPRDDEPVVVEESLSIDLTCTNRLVPNDLRAGSICQAVAGSPTVAQFKNITEVTRPTRPPLGSELYWRLLAHMGLNHTALSHANSLRALLQLYNLQGLSDQAVGRANSLRAEAISGVTSSPVQRIVGGVPLRGVRTTVEVDEDKFAGAGDAFLFGQVLDALFADHVTLNAFNELGMKLVPSQREIVWTPRAGTKPIV